MLTADKLQSLAEACAEASRLGGVELLARLRQERRVEHKGSIDLVTDADRAAEEAVVAFIERRFPGHAILAEERGALEGRGTDLRWVVNPLDGTTNYAHRVPHFCVSVAVEEAAGPLAAAVLDPCRDELFQAAAGLGATLNGAAIHVSAEAALGKALLATGFPYDIWTSPDRPLGLLGVFIRRAQGIRRAGSAALDLCWTACGRYDGFFEVKLKPWDVAGGALIVTEAGGTVTNLAGGPLDYARGEVLASNGRFHRQMVELAGQVPS